MTLEGHNLTYSTVHPKGKDKMRWLLGPLSSKNIWFLTQQMEIFTDCFLLICQLKSQELV